MNALPVMVDALMIALIKLEATSVVAIVAIFCSQIDSTVKVSMHITSSICASLRQSTQRNFFLLHLCMQVCYGKFSIKQNGCCFQTSLIKRLVLTSSRIDAKPHKTAQTASRIFIHYVCV